ncbi:MAG: hypothetical protein ACLTBX_07055 [Clostridia bacterium]
MTQQQGPSISTTTMAVLMATIRFVRCWLLSTLMDCKKFCVN